MREGSRLECNASTESKVKNDLDLSLAMSGQSGPYGVEKDVQRSEYHRVMLYILTISGHLGVVYYRNLMMVLKALF